MKQKKKEEDFYICCRVYPYASPEKVHFQHTAKFIAQLINEKANYTLQVGGRALTRYVTTSLFPAWFSWSPSLWELRGPGGIQRIIPHNALLPHNGIMRSSWASRINTRTNPIRMHCAAAGCSSEVMSGWRMSYWAWPGFLWASFSLRSTRSEHLSPQSYCECRVAFNQLVNP